MRYGLDVPTTGDYADARTLAALAADAEAAGWDGFFLWDILLSDDDTPTPILDPWIALTAIALRTTRIKIGLFVTPLARHRPWLVARRLANLDHLSTGRVICAAGLGHLERDFTAFGAAGDPATRAAQLDEALAILTGLWTSDHFSFTGDHYTLHDVTLRPRPVQSPRVPLWIAGGWPHRAPFRRAARWDGACLKSYHQQTRQPLTPADFGTCLAYVREHRTTTSAPFDVIISGDTFDMGQRQSSDLVRPFSEAGATWWVEEGLGYTVDEFRARIRFGPPRTE